MILLTALACSSEESGGGSGGSNSGGAGNGSCDITSDGDVTFTSITAAAGSDAACPTIPVSDLNSTDDGGAECAPVVDEAACSATVDCDMGGVQVSGEFTVSGSDMTGEISVSLPTDGGSLDCVYEIEGTTG